MISGDGADLFAGADWRELTTKTDERGQLRFPACHLGCIARSRRGWISPYLDIGIRIGAGATIEGAHQFLTLAALADSVVVRGFGSRLDARDFGFGTRFGADDLDAIPMRRSRY